MTGRLRQARQRHTYEQSMRPSVSPRTLRWARLLPGGPSLRSPVADYKINAPLARDRAWGYPKPIATPTLSLADRRDRRFPLGQTTPPARAFLCNVLDHFALSTPHLHYHLRCLIRQNTNSCLSGYSCAQQSNSIGGTTCAQASPTPPSTDGMTSESPDAANLAGRAPQPQNAFMIL